MKIWKHGGKDWCHICGRREEFSLDVFYSRNAENNPRDEGDYLRICTHCIDMFRSKLNSPCKITSGGETKP